MLTNFYAGQRGLNATDKVWLVRQARAVVQGALDYCGPPRGKAKHLRRCYAGGGRPSKAVCLRDELFRWFASVRGLCAGRIHDALRSLSRQADTGSIHYCALGGTLATRVLGQLEAFVRNTTKRQT